MEAELYFDPYPDNAVVEETLKTSQEWTKDLKRWYPPEHVIWKVIKDLEIAEERLKPKVDPWENYDS